MVDIQEKRYFAQCLQHLSSANLAAFLDLLLLHHPSDVVERKGGDSYHIDFGTLSEGAFVLARKFIKDALKDDDEQLDAVRQDSLSSLQTRQDSIGLPPLPSPTELSSASLSGPFADARDANQQNGSKVEEKAQLPLDATPVLPYPSGASGGTTTSLDSITVSPEKRSSRLKRQRRSSSSSAEPDEQKPREMSKKEESRYYNGERIWRHPTMDKTFTFHGVNVVLLGQQADTTKPWICTLCNKSFVSKDKVVNHVQQHSGEKLHECPICHGRFSSKHYLKEHEKRVHQFDCHQCGKVFSTFDELHEHSLQAHPKLEAKPCNCKKGCANSRCTCFKNGLNCTASCLCENCNNQG